MTKFTQRTLQIIGVGLWLVIGIGVYWLWTEGWLGLILALIFVVLIPILVISGIVGAILKTYRER